jgi:hypothetical protein
LQGFEVRDEMAGASHAPGRVVRSRPHGRDVAVVGEVDARIWRMLALIACTIVVVGVLATIAGLLAFGSRRATVSERFTDREARRSAADEQTDPRSDRTT